MTKVPYATDKLIGNDIENFYNLGIKDRISFEFLSKHLENLSRMDKFSSLFKTCLQMVENENSGDHFDKLVKAYADGLGVKKESVYLMIYLPEVISSQSKWVPNFLGLIPGCSSLFEWDAKNKATIHTRILDFPLLGQYENHERAISFNLNGYPKIFSFNTRGIPFPALTSMNEHGLTIAIHQKFSNFFNPKGDPIVKIAFELIASCRTTREVKKALKQAVSMTYWGIYCSDREGNVLCIDVCGREQYSKYFDLKEKGKLYFNNIPLFQDEINLGAGPLQYQKTCEMKCMVVEKQKSKKTITPLSSIELLGQSDQLKSEDAREWKQSPLTPASVQFVSFDSKNMQAYAVLGEAPKYVNEVVEFSKLFSNINQKVHQLENKLGPKFITGMNFCAKAQASWDLKEFEKAYHEIQMGMSYLKGYGEHQILKFFFNVFQYINADSTKDFKMVYAEFLEQDNLLPPILEDHRILFLMRIEKVCGMHVSMDKSLIESPGLREIFEKELKLKGTVLKMMRKLIYPRIEIPDVLYMY